MTHDRLFDLPLRDRRPPAHGPGCHRLEHARSFRDGGPRYVCVPGCPRELWLGRLHAGLDPDTGRPRADR